MQGPPGEGVSRSSSIVRRELLKIKRARYELKPVEGAPARRLREHRGAAIKIRLFLDGHRHVAALLEQPSGKGFARPVLDMRRNPVACSIKVSGVADEFIADGPIVKTAGKGGHVMDEAGTRASTWLGFPWSAVAATARRRRPPRSSPRAAGSRRAATRHADLQAAHAWTWSSISTAAARSRGLKLTVARYYTPSGADPGHHARRRR